jgi:hypothetical protein
MATAKAETRAECPLCVQPHIVSSESITRNVAEDRWSPTPLGERLYAEWKQQKAIEAAQRDAAFTSEYQLWSMWLEQQTA